MRLIDRTSAVRDPARDRPAAAGLTRRRQWLCAMSASALAACGGGGDDAAQAPSAAAAEAVPGRAPQARESAVAEALSMGSGTGFMFAGATQVLRVGAEEVFVPLGRYAKVLVAPLTTGPGVVATPGAPVLSGVDDEVAVPALGARVLSAAGARGIVLRSGGPSACSVQLFLGA